MFRKQRQFNIISGQPTKSFNQRSRSFVQDLNKLHLNPKNFNSIRRLDRAKDSKEFQYSYCDLRQSLKGTNQAKNNEKTLLNYVSTDYNIINHSRQHATSQIAYPEMFDEIKRKSPLTVHLKNSILFAPNYRPDYAEKLAKHEFHLKRSGFLEEICQLQKRAGGRYFRVQK